MPTLMSFIRPSAIFGNTRGLEYVGKLTHPKTERVSKIYSDMPPLAHHGKYVEFVGGTRIYDTGSVRSSTKTGRIQTRQCKLRRKRPASARA